MVFDVRGRRKHVVRVVYAILALLMGASLFLVVGPFNAATLFGGESTKSAASIDLEQVEKLEEKVRRDPKSEALLLSLTRAHILAAGALSPTNPTTGFPEVTPEALLQYGRASESWASYIKQTDRPDPFAAKQMAETYIKLAEKPGSVEEANANIEKAAKTQRIAAEAQPSLGSLSSLASYEYFAGNYAQGDRAAAQALRKTVSKEEAKELKEKMAAARARAKQYEKEVREFKKKESETGKERLQNPFGGLGSSGGSSLGQ